jgi:uncharacterized protein (TIGR02001 family)
MKWTIRRILPSGVVALLAAGLLAGPVLADGMPTRRTVRAPEPAPEARRCGLSANVALTTDYIFRGFSQTGEGPAVQGGFDVTCGWFYVGVWGSSLDWGVVERNGPDATWAYLELDPYAGIKGKYWGVSWDVGVIYYGYPNSTRNHFGTLNTPDFERFRNEYLEVKAGGTVDLWRDATLGVTAFWSPDYQYEVGDTLTVEGGIAQAFPAWWGFTPTVSALIGYQRGYDDDYRLRGPAAGDDAYTYWNAGVTFAFLEKWSLDLRYWDTDLPDRTWCSGDYFQCDERFVATLKFTY